MLIPLGSTAASAKDASFHQKMFESSVTILMISNEEMNDITKIVTWFEEFGLSTKSISETVNNKAKEKKGGFLGTLLIILGAILLGNLLTAKGPITAGEATIRAANSSSNKFWNTNVLSKWT